MAFGVPDELYWSTTPVELGALLKQMDELESRREYNRSLRAGFIVAEMRNAMGSKRRWKATDFVRDPRKSRSDERPLSTGETRAFLKGWAMRANAAQKAGAR